MRELLSTLLRFGILGGTRGLNLARQAIGRISRVSGGAPSAGGGISY